MNFCCCFKNYTKDILDQENIPWLSLNGQNFYGKVIDVYDADTITIVFPFEKKPYKVKCRLSGIDSPEIRTTNDKEKQAAIIARDWLRNKILNKKLWFECSDFDKYGRVLIKIYMKQSDVLSINQELINMNFAYNYDGNKKRKFNDWFYSK